MVAHRPDARIPGCPTLCAGSVGNGEECACDGHGQATIGLYDRAARLMGREVSVDWWMGSNDFLEGARPVDVLSLGRLDDVDSALDAAEARSWGS